MAIDYGEKRCGIAVTDEMQIIASGLATVPTPEIFDFLQSYFAKETVSAVVIGEPKQLDNSPSQSAAAVEKFTIRFASSFPDVKIIRLDERFTSKMAFQTMIDSGLKKKQRQNKGLVDEIAATILLQDYLARLKF